MSTRNGGRILPGMYQRRTAVWEGRGATARPWEAKWSSGVAAVCWSTKYITTKNMGFLELKKCFFKRGCFGCGDFFWCSDRHEIVFLFPLHLTPV